MKKGEKGEDSLPFRFFLDSLFNPTISSGQIHLSSNSGFWQIWHFNRRSREIHTKCMDRRPILKIFRFLSFSQPNFPPDQNMEVFAGWYYEWCDAKISPFEKKSCKTLQTFEKSLCVSNNQFFYQKILFAENVHFHGFGTNAPVRMEWPLDVVLT